MFHSPSVRKPRSTLRAAAEEAVKDQTARGKQSMGLEERRKHAIAKAKKLKKALMDVSVSPIYPLPGHRVYLGNTASFSTWQFPFISRYGYTMYLT